MIFPTRDRTCVSCIAGTFFTTEPPGKPDLRPERLQVAARLGFAPWNSKAGKNPEKGGTEKRRPSLGALGAGGGVTLEQSPSPAVAAVVLVSPPAITSPLLPTGRWAQAVVFFHSLA